MKFWTINIFVIMSFCISSLYAEEITDWRDMSFYAPSVNINFNIRTNFYSSLRPTQNGKTGEVDIEPNYFAMTGLTGEPENAGIGPDTKWYWGNCSLETLKYAHKLTDRSRKAKVTMMDKGGWRKSENIDVKTSPKYIFSVQTANPSESMYEGFITEEEFTTLANMLLKDVSATSIKRTVSTDTAKTAEFAEYLTKELGELSELKKSPSAN